MQQRGLTLTDKQLHELEVLAASKAPHDRLKYQQLHDFSVAELRHELDTADCLRQSCRGRDQHSAARGQEPGKKRRKLSAKEVQSARQLIQTVLRGVHHTHHSQVGTPVSMVGHSILDDSKTQHGFPELHFIRGCSSETFLGFDE
ncbi:hypothetical protein BJ741DRAFT_583992 [Chytriomyces cf. hyalinus JEL632]|nr:hypothetical protein BJ741DRAFT_583992 [Chytriomyces cf. hyalinus JEL632]